MYRRAQMGIGYLPQETSIFRKLSVADNIRAVLEAQGIDKACIVYTPTAATDRAGLVRTRQSARRHAFGR